MPESLFLKLQASFLHRTPLVAASDFAYFKPENWELFFSYNLKPSELHINMTMPPELFINVFYVYFLQQDSTY